MSDQDMRDDIAYADTTNTTIRDDEQYHTKTEVLTVSGGNLMSSLAHIIRQGNAFRITVKDQQGTTLLDIPVGVGVVGTALFPSIAAISIVGVMVADLRIVIEKKVHNP